MFHTNNESENCTNQEIYCAVLKTIVLCRKSKGLLSMKLCFWYLACRSHIFCCTVFSFYPGKSVGKQSRRVLCLSGYASQIPNSSFIFQPIGMYFLCLFQSRVFHLFSKSPNQMSFCCICKHSITLISFLFS